MWLPGKTLPGFVEIEVQRALPCLRQAPYKWQDLYTNTTKPKIIVWRSSRQHRNTRRNNSSKCFSAEFLRQLCPSSFYVRLILAGFVGVKTQRTLPCRKTRTVVFRSPIIYNTTRSSLVPQSLWYKSFDLCQYVRETLSGIVPQSLV